MIDRIDRVNRRLLRWAIERHDFLAGIFQWFADSRTIWWVLNVTPPVLGGVVLNDWWWAVMAFFWAVARLLKMHLPYTVIYYELGLWIYMVGALFSITAEIASRMPVDFHFLLLALVWIDYSYLLVDLFHPPRKRRKIKIAVRQPKPAYEGIIS